MTHPTDQPLPLPRPTKTPYWTGYTADQMRHYAEANVAAERERWAAELARAVADERERCAALVEQFPHWLGNQGRSEIAAAIRKG